MNTIYQFHGQTLDRSQTASRLKALALDGLRRRYPRQADQLVSRLCGELSAVGENGELMQRLVILWDLARYAGVHRIAVQPDGEKLARSLTARCLDIVQEDSAECGMEFLQLPDELRLDVPASAWPELSAYLKLFYPGIEPERVMVRDDRLSAMTAPPEALEGEEVNCAAAWLAELRRRLDELQEQMADVEDPQDFCGVRFEYWMERYMDLREQIDLLERLLQKRDKNRST